jgi:hypothetical protein
LAAGGNSPLMPHRLPQWGEFGYGRKSARDVSVTMVFRG